MNPATTFVMAAQAILRHKLRAALTALGVVIGVASVIGMVHIGQSAKESVRSQISSLGDNLLMVRPGAGPRGPGGARANAAPFELEDSAAIAAQVDGLTVAPVVNHGALVVWGNVNWPTAVTGTTVEFFEVRQWKLERGRLFEEQEVRSAAPVCVLGATVYNKLFGGGRESIGDTIRVGNVSCQVIGVLTSKQSSMGSDPDDVVVMPLRTVQRRLSGSTDVGMLYLTAPSHQPTASVKKQIEEILRERRRIKPGDDDDFSVMSMDEIAQRVEGTTDTMTALLGSIAAVSLLVGGIGIMNIMLVSVTERTREIGIRMAIGARGREVLTQFLMESIILSTLGGIIGIGLGLGGFAIAADSLGMPFVLIPEIVVFAFFFSAVVGVVFGYVPARKAARLDPMEALRHE
ncbi:MAG: ABC transporter permease [Myxococcales bacterium]|nr:ABC transporter permease [Myxococcales bacterium]